MKRIDSLKFIAFIAILFFCYGSAYSKEIKIGQSLPLTGKFSEAADAYLKGVNAWFKEINNNGGINGNKIKLITMDDKGDSTVAAKNSEDLILKDILVLFGYMGYDSSLASAEIAKKTNIPFFAPVTGARDLHSYTNRNIFSIRPGYYTEIKNIVSSLLKEGDQKISLFYSNDNWSKNCLRAAEWYFEENKLPIFAKIKAESNSASLMEKSAKEVTNSHADAVIIFSESDTAIPFIKALRKNKSTIKIFTVSEVDGDQLSKKLVNQGIGVVVSQVVPFPYYRRIPIVGSFNSFNEKYYPGNRVSFYGLEGFVSAKALTEIIREMGDNITRKNFIETAENMRPINLGGFIFKFSAKNHTGSSRTYLTQIGPGGFLSPIRSIKDIYKYNAL